MNTLKQLRICKIKLHLESTTRYGKPLNRWQWHYANEDGVFEQDFNYIELKTMPQPFPQNDFIFSHKGLPKDRYPAHLNDVRYNFRVQNWPRRHFSPDFLLRQYNYSDADQIMHSIQWTDMEIDYQLADPMETNHYVQGRAPSFVVFIGMCMVLFIIIYPLWGYGVIEASEEPYRFRKIFQFPSAGLGFTWLASFLGNNYNLNRPSPSESIRQISGARLDKDGNVLPNFIKRYHFEDEYTYRI